MKDHHPHSRWFAERLVEESPDALIALSFDGTVLSWNAGAASMLGFAAAEAVGRDLVELTVPEPQRGAARETIRRVVAEGSVVGEETRQHKDGRAVGVHVSMRRVDDAGIPPFIAVRKRDVSAQQQPHLKSEFLANMSHELRTPLNAIIGFAELMYKGKVGPVAADHREYLGDILMSARHLLQLINDVVDLAKVESGKMQFRPEPVNLRRLATEVRDDLSGLALDKQLTLDLHVDDSLGEVRVDPARVKQLLYNCLSHTIKFSDEQNTITIAIARESEARFRIDVTDTSAGSAPETIASLASAFQQLDASSAKDSRGAGLALVLTKRIAEAHGGHVAERNAAGEGHTFTIVLPRVIT